MDYIKPKLWKGNDLKGPWLFTYKIDGVRMLRDEDGNPVSRAGKPLYNLEHVPQEIVDAEIFSNDWESSITLVRTKHGNPVDMDNVYTLDSYDYRLIIRLVNDPSKDFIDSMLKSAVDKGYEGLVLENQVNKKRLKVKPSENYDVKITGMIEGTGKYKGMMGAIETEKGKVGTGFTDEQRAEYFISGLIDTDYIEVECMSLTKDGKFRHPRFVRCRPDK